MLNTLESSYGSTKKRMRVGRGIGSGKGKTCGRGGKGQTARSGVAVNGFEGGQMPIYRRLPLRGFCSLNRVEYQPINLPVLAELVAAKLLDANNIDNVSLFVAGLIKNIDVNVKILGKLTSPVVMKIKTNAASQSALKSVQEFGGELTI